VDTTVVRSVRFFASLVQKAGPYLLLEILLPGGTLFALLLFVYQRRQALGGANAQRPAVVIAHAIRRAHAKFMSVARPFRAAASVWRGRHRERDGLEALAIGPAA
jgi:hypothetical protein